MEMKGTSGVWSSSSLGYGDKESCEDRGKHVWYTAEQVEVLEKVFAECPKLCGSQRLEIIRENPILSSLESKQIKVWFQNRRCCEKQKKEAIGIQSVNEKLAATKKLLLAENDRLQKELLQLVNENEYIRQLLQNVSAGTTFTGCESAVNSLQHSSMAADKPTGLILLDEDAMGVFPSRTATGWVPIPRMKICNGVEENSFQACVKLIFTPTNEMLTNDATLLSSVIKTAITPFGLRPFPASPEVVAFANWICQSVRSSSGGELLNADYTSLDPVLKRLMHHQGSVLCCSFKSLPVCLFANQAGLLMLETALASLQGIKLDLIFSKSGQEALDSILLAIRQQGIAVLWSGFCISVMAPCVV